MTAQYDLFGELEATETLRHNEALTCLRDSLPTALHAVTALTNWTGRSGGHNPGMAGDWAYAIDDPGIRYEHVSTWGPAGGWSRTPAHLLTWDQLAALVTPDPRHADLVAWAQPDAEGLRPPLHRPYELWPDPEGWHPSYIEGDRADPEWPARLHAWTTLQQLLTEAMR